MYPIFFRQKVRLYVAAVALLVGAILLLPPLGFDEGWLGYVFGLLLAGGFGYLFFWENEFFRILNKRQKKRTGATFAVRGLQVGLMGVPFFLFDLGYALAFRSEEPYHFVVRSIGGILVVVWLVATVIGLVWDWRDMPGEVERAARRALLHMKESSFEIDDRRLWIGIDCRLSTLGRSYPLGDESVILVLAWTVYAADYGSLDTLVHEMSHVYLTQKNSPSHNARTFHEIYDPIVRKFPKRWQSKIIRAVMDYLPEVFTEDIAFRVFEKSKQEWGNSLLGYFRRKLTMRSFAISAKRRRWMNALVLVRNSYYAAEMERYQMPDEEGIVKKANEKFLSSQSADASNAFTYFHDKFIELTSNITEEDYKKILENYLSRFISLADGNSPNWLATTDQDN